MEQNHYIDELDKKILSIIKENARIPFLEVARECRVSGAAIHQRVQRLIKVGVIKGSEFIIDPKKLGYNTCAYMGIYLEKASMFKEVVKQLQAIPEITQCHYTTGNYAIFIKVFTKDNEDLKSILIDKLQAIDGISRTETFISLEESFNRQLPVE